MIKIKMSYFTNSSSNLFKYLLQRGSFCQSFGVRMGMHTGDLSRAQNPSSDTSILSHTLGQVSGHLPHPTLHDFEMTGFPFNAVRGWLR